MKTLMLVAVIIAICGSAAADPAKVFPPRGDWPRAAPSELGLDRDALQAAIAFAIEHETRFPRELADKVSARDLTVKVPLDFAREPLSSPIGPIEPRGEPTGLIIRSGRIVAEWGDPSAVEMTFSITKTFLSHVAGLAYDAGRIPDLDAPVAALVPDPRFHTAHNAPITWDHMLRQTSGWTGTLFGKPDWVDRPRGTDAYSDLAAGPPTPGEAWEYNDVRVNALALALLHVWKRPLPAVLAERIMTPIGASDTWRWEAYENAQVEIEGETLLSVPGGGHWGGGMFINAYDLARLGVLGLHRGDWDGERVLSEDWFEMSATPTPQRPDYGFMNFFLNTPNAPDAEPRFPTAPASAWVYYGAGTNLVYVDAENDLVAVARWIDSARRGDFIAKVLAAIEGA